MGKLRLEDRLEAPDEVYQALVNAHEGLTDAESRQLNARLILLLANHIGDQEALAEALTAARESVVADRERG